MTRDSQDGSKDRHQLDREVLQAKIKIYYIFVVAASLMLVTYVTLISIYLLTTPEEDQKNDE